jgi:ELWxxDGT repeat protein
MPLPWDRPHRSQSTAVRSARSRRARPTDHRKFRDRALSIEPLEQRMLLAVVPSMLADLRSGTGSSNPHAFVEVGGYTYFAANDGATGTELWRTNATGTVTERVKDIRTGSSSSNPQSLVNMGGILYFSATNGTAVGANGTELWRSDGTDAGTWMVKDIAAGTAGSAPTSLTVIGDTLYFVAATAANGAELWRSDGTAAETRIVKDIQAGSSSSGVANLVVYNGKLYFSADDGTNGAELWTSDGTDAGTQMVKNINAGSSASYPFYMTAVNGTLYFQADNGINGTELWRTDGTEAGTWMVADIYGGTDPSNPDPGANAFSSLPYSLTAVGDTLFFLANDGLHGSELWKTDGTEDGTQLVRDINTVTPDPFGPSNPSNADYLTNVNGVLFFQANDGTHGAELWKSNGTEVGTTMVRDINPGLSGSDPNGLVNLSGALYFSANDGVNGYELWRSRGTADTTKMPKNEEIRPGTGSSTPQDLAVAGNSLYFSADNGTNGREPWYIGPNAAPTDMTLAPTIVPENRDAGAPVGTLTTVDPDSGDEFTYYLPAGYGDNSKFTIDANQLKTFQNIQAPTTFQVYAEVRDLADNSYFEWFTLQLGSIAVTPNGVQENSPLGTQVGVLSSAIGGAAQSGVTYSLWAAGDKGDNQYFTVEDRNSDSTYEVYTKAVFNYEAGHSYLIAVQAQGPGGTYWTYEPITIVDVNEAPVATNDLYNTPAGTPLTVNPTGVLGNDSDPDVLWPQTQVLHGAVVTGPAHGTLALHYYAGTSLWDGGFTWTPDAGWLGGDTFTYQAIDDQTPGLSSNVATVRINAGPVGQEDSFEVQEDHTLDTLAASLPSVLANDWDYDGDPITAVQVTGPAHGTLEFYSTGYFKYVPAANYFGTDSFTYKAYDGNTYSSPVAVHLTITPENDAPVAYDDSYPNLGDQILKIDTAHGVLVNDIQHDVDIQVDPTNDKLTVTAYTQPASGTVEFDADKLGGFTYTPVFGYTGTVTFTYTVTDSFGESDQGEVTIVCQPMSANALVNVQTTLWEGAGVIAGGGRVTIPRGKPGDANYDPRLQGDIEVYLESSNTSLLKLPASVVVPADKDYAVFDLYLQDDSVFNSTPYPSVTITARARGLLPGTLSAVVHDNEPSDFMFGSQIVITEVSDQTPDYLEIQNVSADTVSVQGWRVVVNDASSGDPNQVHPSLSLAGDMTADSIRYWTDDPLDRYFGADIAWGSSTGKGWVMLLDATGTLRDFVAWGYTTEQIASMTPVIDGVHVHVGSAWSGAGVSYAGTNSTSLQRVGRSDSNIAGDFVWEVSSKNNSNSQLVTPFAISSPQRAGEYFRILVNGVNSQGEVIPTLSGTFPIYAESASGILPVSVEGRSGGLVFNGGEVPAGVAVLSAGSRVRLVVDDGYGHIGRSDYFDVITGEMVKLKFSDIPADLAVGQPFQVTVTAVDSNGYPVSGYAGPVYLSGWVNGGTAPSVVITEISDQTPDYVEIQNVSSGEVPVQGWKIVANDASAANPNAIHTPKSLTGTMVADEVRYWTDSSTNHYFGQDIAWGSSTAKGWVMILDDSYAVRDFLAWGYSQSEIQSIALSLDGHAVRVGSAWSGAGVSYAATDATSLQRWGSNDGNVASDFLWQANTKGQANSMLVAPFSSATAVAITPQVSGNFIDGKWTGMVTITQPAANMYLRAIDAACYTAPSGTFTANAANFGSGIGGYDPATSTFYLRCANDSGYSDYTFGYGEPHASDPDNAWLPIAGDWDGDGVDTVGLYDPRTSLFYLSNSNKSGYADVVFAFGPGGVQIQQPDGSQVLRGHTYPVAGDWNGDGIDTVGIYDWYSSTFYISNHNATGVADFVIAYGEPHPSNGTKASYDQEKARAWRPTAGDWDGDTFDALALYDPQTSLYYIKGRLGSGYADVCFGYGQPGAGWRPFAGNWTNSGFDSVAVNDPHTALYYERYSNTSGYADKAFGYGAPGWLPIAGDWNGPALLSASAQGTANANPIDAAAVQPLVAAAADRWSTAGLSDVLVDRIRNVNLVVTDLAGTQLGRAEGNTLYLDSTAAGYGWFVDPTPQDDLEFTAGSSHAALVATDAAAAGRIDLLTVVAHELGHVAGLEDLAASADSLMAGILEPGLRREPGTAEIDALLSDPDQDWL